jgi:DNA-binding winged helix-turn-helix (wHTH) protein
VFDSETRQLFRGRAPVELSPKALSLLELLLERAPLAVAKAEIQKSIWPKTFVTEANLTNLISEIRAAVDDSARHPRFIRTVHRFGYSFQGELTDDRSAGAPLSEKAPLYRLILGNRKMPLVAGENIMGRHPDAQVRVDQSSVSRLHARIVIGDGKAVLEDLKSRNGTFLRERRLTAPAELRDGDLIGLGPIQLVFRVYFVPGSTEAGSDVKK